MGEGPEPVLVYSSADMNSAGSLPFPCQDLLGETPIPPVLKEQPSFAFLNKRLELALQSAA